MPPRHVYWTILIDNKPTAFRAREKADLLPTLAQLRRSNADVVMKWFARGRIWDSPEAEGEARRRVPAEAQKRGRDWRPGGMHKDPRERFTGKKEARRQTLGPPGEPRPWRDKTQRSDRPAGPPRGDRPWGKPPSGRTPGDRPRWQKFSKPAQGDRPWTKTKTKTTTDGRSKPPFRDPRNDRPWSGKPDGPPSGPPRGDRPWMKSKSKSKLKSKPTSDQPPSGPPGDRLQRDNSGGGVRGHQASGRWRSEPRDGGRPLPRGNQPVPKKRDDER
jgi:hypothetical protein